MSEIAVVGAGLMGHGIALVLALGLALFPLALFSSPRSSLMSHPASALAAMWNLVPPHW